MKTTRSSKHSLKFSNKGKLSYLHYAFDCFKELVKLYMKEILSNKLPLEKVLSTAKLPILNEIVNAQWRSVAYKTASETIRSNLRYVKEKTFNHDKEVNDYLNNLKRYKHSTDIKIVGKPIIIFNQQ